MSADKGKPSDWAARQAAIDAAARAIIGQETALRDAKTAKLKALREASAADQPVRSAVTRSPGAGPRTRRAKSQRRI